MAVNAEVKNDQQTQNELEYLYRKHLIDRADNNGVVDDGCRYVYFKDENVRTHKGEIIRAADNKKLRESIPTKRNPVVRGTTLVVKRTVVNRQALKKHKRLDVLYLMANPIRRHSLRVDAEVSKVSEEIRRSRFRDNINLHQSPAANLDAIIRGLNDHRPRIVHFSGHGNGRGLAGDDGGIKRTKTKFVSFDILGKALRATDSPPDIIVLNACQSVGARNALLGAAKAIIVMQDSISDIAAVAFATKFYGGIASGHSPSSRHTTKAF